MDHWNDLVWSIFEKVQKIGPMLDLGGGVKKISIKSLMFEHGCVKMHYAFGGK